MGQTPHSARLTTWAFVLLFGGAALSYMSQSLGQLVGYMLAFSGIVTLAISYPIVSRLRAHLVFLLCVGMLLTSLLSMLAASQYATGVRAGIQSGMYPIILACLLLYGWRFFQANLKLLGCILLGVGMLNAIVALLASIGAITRLPLVGGIPTGRYIFGTDLPSSTGLAFNVNYYSTLQGSIFMLYAWIWSILSAERRCYHLVFGGFLFSTIVIGSSRGVLAAILLAGVAWLVLRFMSVNWRAKLKYLAVAGPGVCIAIILLISGWDSVSDAFRVSRGLNGRDVIWSGGIQIWLERPLLGYGYVGSTKEMLGVLIDRPGSLHSGYLSTLHRGGLLLFILVYGGALGITALGLGLSRKRWWRYRWPVIIVVFWLSNSAIRSFNLGGLGLLPVAVGIALSVILYARFFEIKNRSRSTGTADSGLPMGVRGVKT